jgi:hypothetical protein
MIPSLKEEAKARLKILKKKDQVEEMPRANPKVHQKNQNNQDLDPNQ